MGIAKSMTISSSPKEQSEYLLYLITKLKELKDLILDYRYKDCRVYKWTTTESLDTKLM